jgi:hypothetical protein
LDSLPTQIAARAARSQPAYEGRVYRAAHLSTGCVEAPTSHAEPRRGRGWGVDTLPDPPAHSTATGQPSRPIAPPHAAR